MFHAKKLFLYYTDRPTQIFFTISLCRTTLREEISFNLHSPKLTLAKFIFFLHSSKLILVKFEYFFSIRQFFFLFV